jgi:iron complex transport system ATP-binding protein
VVIVLHDINFAARYASHICAMKDGRVVHFGEAEQVMNPAVLTDVFNTQVDVVGTEHGRIAIYY